MSITNICTVHNVLHFTVYVITKYFNSFNWGIAYLDTTTKTAEWERSEAAPYIPYRPAGVSGSGKNNYNQVWWVYQYRMLGVRWRA